MLRIGFLNEFENGFHVNKIAKTPDAEIVLDEIFKHKNS